ncbi:hypothetical protein ABT173_25430 [Streptomyces sp. NPDC001795]|uniref:hypothetical protein n=1 Tax=unclassified Streptomyces TaxID=2593676 RepID=UPI0033234FDC
MSPDSSVCRSATPIHSGYAKEADHGHIDVQRHHLEHQWREVHAVRRPPHHPARRPA